MFTSSMEHGTIFSAAGPGRFHHPNLKPLCLSPALVCLERPHLMWEEQLDPSQAFTLTLGLPWLYNMYLQLKGVSPGVYQCYQCF